DDRAMREAPSYRRPVKNSSASTIRMTPNGDHPTYPTLECPHAPPPRDSTSTTSKMTSSMRSFLLSASAPGKPLGEIVRTSERRTWSALDVVVVRPSDGTRVPSGVERHPALGQAEDLVERPVEQSLQELRGCHAESPYRGSTAHRASARGCRTRRGCRP